MAKTLIIRKKKERDCIVGIDLSMTHTGYCVATQDFKFSITGAVGSYVKERIEDRILSIYGDIEAQVFEPMKKRIDYVIFEGLAFSGRGQRAAQAAGLHYYCRSTMVEMFPSFKLGAIPIKTLKKWVSGDGNAKKSMMLLKCFQRFGFEAPDDDICDAYCLVKFAFANYSKLENPKWIG